MYHQVPFGDNFHCQLQFVGEAASPTTSRLRVKTCVKFTKSNWLRGIIAREAEAVRWVLFATYCQHTATDNDLPMPCTIYIYIYI